MDVTDIEAGVDFVEVLQRAVGSCDALLAVVGREWLTSADRNGRRRLDDPQDFIRLEIGIALTRNVRVIPVLVEGAVMPAASELPSDLEGLTRRQAVELRDARWNADVDSLAGVLDRVLGQTSAGHESTRSATNQPRRAKWWGFAALAFVAALIAVVTLVPRGGSSPSAPAPQTATPVKLIEPVEQRTFVEAERPASASPGSEARTNPAPATEQPTVTPAPPVPQPAPTATTPAATTAPATVPPATAPADRAAAPGGAGTVVVYYVSDDDQKTAEDLAAELRKSIDDARYTVRTLKTARGIEWEGQVRYSSSGFSTLAATLARSAGSSLSRMYGRRVGFTPTVDPRVNLTAVLVVIPGRSSAPAAPVADAVVVIFYAAADDQKVAEELADFLRTLVSGWKYELRIVRTTASARKQGQIEYDNERMAGLAQVLARDPAAWLSRAYGRRVVLRPTLGEKVGPNAVVLWLPSR